MCITPGLSATTAIPSGNSFATDLVKPSTAHLDAQYGATCKKNDQMKIQKVCTALERKNQCKAENIHYRKSYNHNFDIQAADIRYKTNHLLNELNPTF